MHCLRLFIVVLQELHNFYSYYCGVFIEHDVYNKCHLDWLLCE